MKEWIKRPDRVWLTTSLSGTSAIEAVKDLHKSGPCWTAFEARGGCAGFLSELMVVRSRRQGVLWCASTSTGTEQCYPEPTSSAVQSDRAEADR